MQALGGEPDDVTFGHGSSLPEDDVWSVTGVSSAGRGDRGSRCRSSRRNRPWRGRSCPGHRRRAGTVRRAAAVQWDGAHRRRPCALTVACDLRTPGRAEQGLARVGVGAGDRRVVRVEAALGRRACRRAARRGRARWRRPLPDGTGADRARQEAVPPCRGCACGRCCCGCCRGCRCGASYCPPGCAGQAATAPEPPKSCLHGAGLLRCTHSWPGGRPGRRTLVGARRRAVRPWRARRSRTPGNHRSAARAGSRHGAG